jgi:hypothetical protein
MSRPLPVLAAVLACAALASAARAEDPVRHTLPVHEVWKVGETSTAKGGQTTTQKVTVKGEDGSEMPGSRDVEDRVEYEMVTKVLEVDDKGRPTRWQAHFVSWSRKVGDETDASLSGVTVEVTGRGSARAVKVVGSAKTPSDSAAGWLEQQLGPRAGEREERREALVPTKPVVVGESWEVEPAKLVAIFSNPNQRYAPEKSTGKVTLVSVQDGIGELRFEASLQSAALQTPMGPMDWAEGGALVVDTRFTRAIDPARHESRNATKARLSGKAAPPGVSVEVDIRSDLDVTVQAGGALPAEKPADAPK